MAERKQFLRLFAKLQEEKRREEKRRLRQDIPLSEETTTYAANLFRSDLLSAWETARLGDKRRSPHTIQAQLDRTLGEVIDHLGGDVFRVLGLEQDDVQTCAFRRRISDTITNLSVQYLGEQEPIALAKAVLLHAIRVEKQNNNRLFKFRRVYGIATPFGLVSQVTLSTNRSFGVNIWRNDSRYTNKLAYRYPEDKSREYNNTHTISSRATGFSFLQHQGPKW